MFLRMRRAHAAALFVGLGILQASAMAESLRIREPRPQDILYGSTRVEVELDSPRIPGSVRFYLEPVKDPICTVTTAPYTCTFDAGTDFQGRSIRVDAIDQLGRTIDTDALTTTAFPRPERVVRHIIQVPVIVSVEEGLPPNLIKEDLECYWAGRPCTVDGARLIELQEQTPLSILLLVDVSPSVEDQRAQLAAGVDQFLAAFPENAEIKVASFAEHYNALGPFTRDREEIRKQVAGASFRGWGTCVFRSLDRAFEDLQKRLGHRLLFVISDGIDTCDSEFIGLSAGVTLVRSNMGSLYHTVELSRATKAPIYLYRIVNDRPGVVGDRAYEGLARETGGRLFSNGDLYGMKRSFDDLIEDVRATWVVDVALPRRAQPGILRRLELAQVVDAGQELDLRYPHYWDPVSRRRTWMTLLSAPAGFARYQAALNLQNSVEPEVLRELLRAVRREPDDRIRNAELEAILKLSAYFIVHAELPRDRKDGLAAAEVLVEMKPKALELLRPALSVLQKMPVPKRFKRRSLALVQPPENP